MNSVKNLFVIVMLMGVSYGAFQVINAPDPFQEKTAESLDIETVPRIDPTANSIMEPGASSFSDSMADALPKLPPMSADELSIPELELPELEPNPTLNDPKALVQAETTVPQSPEFPENDIDGGFQAPQLHQPPDSMAFNSDDNQFQADPQTSMQPVTPRAEDKPAPEFAEANETAPPQHFADRETVTPENNAENMLESPQDNRADALVNQGQEGPGNAQSPSLAPGGSRASEVNWHAINELASTGQYREALFQLSQHYQAELPQDQRMQMLEWLDLLAGKVIYSTEHLLETRPYVVADGDTLESLAAAWQVPAQLIYNVNRSKIGDPSMLIPGTELKVIQGPFNAVVNLQRQELTLSLAGMYAGRFPIELGEDQGIEHGNFTVLNKLPGRSYTDASGQTIAAGSVENPYGKYWIELNGDLGIHEANPSTGPQDRRGSIRLGSRDAADVFGILSDGSQVTITR